MIQDSFFTILKPAEGEYKEKGSKFLSYSFPFNHESKLESLLDKVKGEHPKARHYCYAYRIGLDMNKFRINDDGEPSGTAGRPILGQIQSLNVTNVIVIVVRYFGGTKLGVPGLINAYKSASRIALENSSIVENFISSIFILNFKYDDMGHILSVIKENHIDILEKKFDEACQITIELRLSEEKTKLLQLKAGVLGVSREEAESISEIPCLKIQKQ